MECSYVAGLVLLSLFPSRSHQEPLGLLYDWVPEPTLLFIFTTDAATGAGTDAATRCQPHSTSSHWAQEEEESGFPGPRPGHRGKAPQPPPWALTWLSCHLCLSNESARLSLDPEVLPLCSHLCSVTDRKDLGRWTQRGPGQGTHSHRSMDLGGSGSACSRV